MLNPIQRYFPKLHRLLAINPNTEVSFDTGTNTQFSPESLDIDSIDSPIALKRLHDASNSLIDEQKPLSVLKPVVPRKTVPIADLLNQAHELLGSGELPEAIDRYRHILQVDPTCGTVYEYLAEALSQQGELEAAAVCYRQAIELSMQEAVSPKLQSSPVQIYENEEESEDEAEDEISWFEAASFYLQQGEALYNLGDWTETIAACEQVAHQIEPQLIVAYLTAAKALQQQNDLNAAAALYLKAIAIQPTAEAHARLGSLYAQQNRLTDAVLQYQQAIALDPQFAGAYWKLAAVLQQSGDVEQALVCRYQALQQSPPWASALEFANLAAELRQTGKLEWAIDCYQQAIRLNPTLAEAYHGLGETLGQQGDWQAAIVQHRQAVLQQPETVQFQLGLGLALLQQAQWDEAVQCFGSVTQLEPKNLQGYQGLGQALGKLDRWAEALSCYQQLADLQPNSGKAFHDLGDTLSHLQQWQAAAAAFQRAIALQPDFSWSHNNLGDALIQLGQWQAAATAFQQAITINPEFHWSHYNLGDVLVKLEQWDGAIAAYQQALELQPEMPHAQRKLADVLRQRAKTDEARALGYYQQAIALHPDDLQNYHQAIALQPDNADLYMQLVDALVRQNNVAGAISFYQIARKIDPDELSVSAQLEKILRRNVPLDFKGYRIGGYSPDPAYAYWLQQNALNQDDLRRITNSLPSLTYRPLISIILPTYNTPEQFLREAIESVLSQVYPDWELCIADDASRLPHVRFVLEEYAARDARIKITIRTQNGHISAASNSALDLATGDFIALLDHDDVLTPNALYEVVNLLNQHPEADMIYSDEDKLDEQGLRINPYFKPDWCPDSFLARMYTCHLGIYRRTLIDRIGGFRLGYEGSQDYDLVLRFTEQTNAIFHLPKILYHWRIHSASAASGVEAKPYAYEAAKRALASALERRGEVGSVVDNERFLGTYTVRYEIKDYKKVSIIIPTRNLGHILERCLHSIFSKSIYPDYEVIVIDNGSDEPEALEAIAAWQQREPERFKTYKLDIPFNFSRLNNFAARKAQGSYLLFLNNDTEVITADWIDAMVEQAQRSSIGFVGGLLLYPDNSIQHAGVLLGVQGIANHSHRHFDAQAPGYFTQIATVNNYSALTGACLMCRREVFEQVNGFDEQLAVAYNDVDICLKVLQQKYRNIYLPHVVLYHHESKSRGHEDTAEKLRRFEQETAKMKHKWDHLLQNDPCYSPNLTREQEDFSLLLPPGDTEVLEISEFIDSSQLILDCSIDSPKVGQDANSFHLGISGWIIGKRSKAVALQIMHEGHTLHTISIDQPRKDVARFHPGFLDAERSGFAAAINATGLSGTFDLFLQVTFEDGSSESLGIIKLQRLVKAD